MEVKLSNGQLVDAGSPEALDILRHSCAHLMAEAVLNLYPGTKTAIGPNIEDGFYYDFDFAQPLSLEELKGIEKEMHRLLKTVRPIEYQEISKQEALKLFANNPYKIELIEELEGKISIFKQGDFVDLCRGPHLANTAKIKYFSLLNVAGAYWRGDSQNKQLTRIYATAFFSQEELTHYLDLVAERKKRDHRLLGQQLELFMFSDFGPGFPFYLPKGVTLFNNLIRYWEGYHQENNYQFIKTPTILSRELWETSGHWQNYRENMYVTNIDERDFVVKPMNCPGALLIYKNELHSYRELPIRLAEIGHVHRHEASGALAGLFRVRAFHQDDAHVFLRPDQLSSEIEHIIKMCLEMYKTFNLPCTIELSTRPEEKYIGTIETWDFAEKVLEEAIKKAGIPFKINPGDGAFYGPKIDFKVRDSMERIWQCGTIQLDMNLPERFDIFYIDAENVHQRPIMLHRAIFGSLERFLGILIEHFGGAFPVWLAPQQVYILPVNDQYHLAAAQQLLAELTTLGVHALILDSQEKLGYRMRKAQVDKIPYSIVLGDQEVQDGTLTYRTYGNNEQVTIKVDEFLELIRTKIHNRD